MSFVIGLDPGLTKLNPLGVAQLSTNGKLIKAWVIEPDETLVWDERLRVMLRHLRTQLSDTPIVVWGVETPHFSRNVATTVKLAYVCGAVLAFSLDSLSFYPVRPSEAKKVLTGRGTAEKSEMQAAVKARFRRNVSKDAADAVGVALAAWEQWRFVHE